MDNFKDTKNSRTMRRINGFYQEKSLNLMISIWTLGLLATQVSRALGAGAPWVGHRFSQVTEPDGESLEEATGLPERPASQPPEPGHGMQQKSSRVPGPSLKDNGGDYTKPEVTVGLSENLRGYLRVQGGFAKDPLHSAPKKIGPLWEMGLSLSHQWRPEWQIFGEGRGSIETGDDGRQNNWVLEQFGFRYRPEDQWLAVVGKERNWRAPGLIVSPSDFIHPQQNLPGFLEQREGVWQTKVSWQSTTQTLDFMVLPLKSADDNGMTGYILRYFARFPKGIDWGLDLGLDEDHLKAGSFVQTIFAHVYKTYGEFGYDGKNQASSYLLGLSYEGINDTVMRGEFYQQDSLWQNHYMFLTERTYVIASGSMAEIGNLLNITNTVFRSLETATWADVVKMDFSIGSRHTLGLSFAEQWKRKLRLWQGTVDWKTSF